MKPILHHAIHVISKDIQQKLHLLDQEERFPSPNPDDSDDLILELKQAVKHLRRIRQELEYISAGLVRRLDKI